MPEALIITGPTGTGKSELGVEVAGRVGGEIISADSRQVYRGLDIGTAKPPEALMHRVPHHGFDRVELTEMYSAGRFAREARGWITEIRGRGRLPIVTGGTGFFIRALIEPLAPDPDLDGERRTRLRILLSQYSTDQLKRWLRRLDPRRAQRLEPEGGPQRLARSLEVALMSGRAHSWWMDQRRAGEPTICLVVCLTLPRAEIYRRTDQRFDRLMEAGFLDEVRLLASSFPHDSPGFKALGYTELLAHLRGEMSLAEATDLAKRNTRQFVRRQLTWFRHQLPDDTEYLEAGAPLDEMADDVASRWRARLEGSPSSKADSPLASGGKKT